MPVVVRMRCTDNDLQIGIGLPQMTDRFHTVPSRRHPHVDKGQRIGPARGLCLPHTFETVLSLECGVDIKSHTGGARHSEQELFVCRQIGVSLRGQKDLLQIVVNGFVVIHDKEPVVVVCDCHYAAVSPSVSQHLIGSSSVKVAPVLVPSLFTVRAPPSCLAARAPECNPNPCPSCLVVNP